MYTKRDECLALNLVTAKVTDDLLVAGNVIKLKHFSAFISKRFWATKVIDDEKITFNGVNILQNADGDINMCMIWFMTQIEPIVVDKSRCKLWNSNTAENKLQAFQMLADELIWLGSGARL